MPKPGKRVFKSGKITFSELGDKTLRFQETMQFRSDALFHREFDWFDPVGAAHRRTSTHGVPTSDKFYRSFFLRNSTSDSIRTGCLLDRPFIKSVNLLQTPGSCNASISN